MVVVPGRTCLIHFMLGLHGPEISEDAVSLLMCGLFVVLFSYSKVGTS